MGMDLYIASAWQAVISRDHLALESHHGEIGPKQVGEAYDIAEERVFLRKGAVVETLRSICAEVDPCIVIVGTLARRGISGKLIGNTAEKLIDTIEADLLTIY
jgi:nucleotide-binding universal stress UspA family protein